MGSEMCIRDRAVTENGYGKRTPVGEYRIQGRGGQGVINIKTSRRNGEVVGVVHVLGEEDLILITSQGKIIRQRVLDVRETATRASLGVKLIDLEEYDQVADITTALPEEVLETEEDEE